MLKKSPILDQLYALYSPLDVCCQSTLESDSGLYECQVNTSPHLAHRVQLTVTRPQCQVEGERSVYLNVGSQHTINCTVRSPEAPHHIFWYFNHQPLPREPAWRGDSSSINIQ